jgi:hypothetical protein
MAIEIVDLPINSMVMFQFVIYKRLPEGIKGGVSIAMFDYRMVIIYQFYQSNNGRPGWQRYLGSSLVE